MLSKKMHDALNAQINAEMWSAYLYLSMSMDAADKGLKGVANWFAVQYREEQDHAQILINYLLSRGARVELAPIAAVTTSWASPLEMFEDTLSHEKEVTAMINDLCGIAEADSDRASSNMLVWFVDEQVEEEQTAADIIGELKMIGEDKLGLYMIDKELGARTYEVAEPLASKAYRVAAKRNRMKTPHSERDAELFVFSVGCCAGACLDCRRESFSFHRSALM